jgi:hypothetical protein
VDYGLERVRMRGRHRAAGEHCWPREIAKMKAFSLELKLEISPRT